MLDVGVGRDLSNDLLLMTRKEAGDEAGGQTKAEEKTCQINLTLTFYKEQKVGQKKKKKKSLSLQPKNHQNLKIMDLMNMMGNMQNLMQEAKEKLDTIMVNGEANGIKVTVTANKALKNIDIPQAMIDEGDKEQIEDLVTIAMNRALEEADVVAAAEMEKVNNSILPGGLGGLANMFNK